MRRVVFIFTLLGSLLLFSCNFSSDESAENTAMVHLDLSEVPLDATMYIINMGADKNTVVDSVLSSGKTKVDITIKLLQSPDIYILQLSPRILIRLVVKQGEEVEIQIKGIDNGVEYDVKGSEGSVLVLEYSELISGHIAIHDSIYTAYRNYASGTDKEELRRNTDSLLKRNYENTYRDLKEMVVSNDHNLASLLGIYSKFGNSSIMNLDYDMDIFRELSDSLTYYYPNNTHALALKNRVDSRESNLKFTEERYDKLDKGNVFPSISLKSIDNSIYNFESSTTKYKIIYLWQANQKSFYEFNKVLRSISKEYKKSDIEIVAIGFEKDMLSWRNYVRMERMDAWTNLIAGADTEKNINPKAEYSLVYVLDSKGKILARMSSLDGIESFIGNMMLKKN